MYYIVEGTEGENIIIQRDEVPASYLQGGFATSEEAQDADWGAMPESEME